MRTLPILAAALAAAIVEAPLAYGFTWVELYARDGADWSAVGNASSPKP